MFLFLIANFIVGFGIRIKEADINDCKTYSLGNFKNLSVLFMTASFVSSVIFWGGILATFINYVITKDLSSYFLGMMANLAGLLLTELFLRMKKKNDDTSAVEQAA